MWPEYPQYHLRRETPERLRPTQMSVGFAEVAAKRREWAALGRKARRAVLEHQVFPAVLGPGSRFYITDHHHLALALIEEEVETVWVAAQDDLSWLETAVFWRTMEFRAWAHPYDAKGRRRDCSDIPARMSSLKDDPYRSLAGRVRHAGGYAKSSAPFAEFLWADFFRSHFSRALLKRDLRRAVHEGTKLARSAAARYLPGWSGSHR
jgi:hypothetical protein